MKTPFLPATILALLARRARLRHRRRRCALSREHRPLRRDHRRFAGQFLYRHLDRARSGVVGGALCGARCDLQNRRLRGGPPAAAQGRETRRRASRLQHAGDGGPSRHGRRGAAAARNSQEESVGARRAQDADRLGQSLHDRWCRRDNSRRRQEWRNGSHRRSGRDRSPRHAADTAGRSGGQRAPALD